MIRKQSMMLLENGTAILVNQERMNVIGGCLLGLTRLRNLKNWKFHVGPFSDADNAGFVQKLKKKPIYWRQSMILWKMKNLRVKKLDR